MCYASPRASPKGAQGAVSHQMLGNANRCEAKKWKNDHELLSK